MRVSALLFRRASAVAETEGLTLSAWVRRAIEIRLDESDDEAAPADESTYFDLIRSIPLPIAKLFFLKCPRCGHRTWNSRGGEALGYQAHYMEHLIEDLYLDR